MKSKKEIEEIIRGLQNEVEIWQKAVEHNEIRIKSYQCVLDEEI